MTEERGTYRVKGRLRRETRLPFADPSYQPPTPSEIRTAMQLSGMTASQGGKVLGVNSRTIRKWIGGESPIPYSAWRLLLLELGEAINVEGHELRVAEQE